MRFGRRVLHLQVEPEGGHISGPAVYSDLATHQPHDSLCNCKPESGAAEATRAGAVGLSERGKKALHLFRGNSNTGIADGKACRNPTRPLHASGNEEGNVSASSELDR